MGLGWFGWIWLGWIWLGWVWCPLLGSDLPWPSTSEGGRARCWFLGQLPVRDFPAGIPDESNRHQEQLVGPRQPPFRTLRDARCIPQRPSAPHTQRRGCPEANGYGRALQHPAAAPNYPADPGPTQGLGEASGPAQPQGPLARHSCDRAGLADVPRGCGQGARRLSCSCVSIPSVALATRARCVSFHLGCAVCPGSL